jgi:2-amino-4-hydroxy-6-hydroxymethyldihydropteridine diphosphokinase
VSAGPHRRAVFGLGSNLGARWRFLADAAGALVALDRDARISSVYASSPVGGPGGQGWYLNAVVALSTDLGPYELLGVARELEQAAGRVRVERHGPRTLDVDLLDLDGVTLAEPELTVPHPRMLERAFVLAPLEEVAPDLVPPGWRDRLGPAALEDALRVVGALVAPGVGAQLVPGGAEGEGGSAR